MMAATKGLFFATGSSKIEGKSFVVLDNVNRILEKNPSYKLHIEGHTDNTGNADKNLKLSESRAIAAKDYFVSKGIDASRIIAVKFGDAKPLDTNDTAEGRQNNRRVDFYIDFK